MDYQVDYWVNIKNILSISPSLKYLVFIFSGLLSTVPFFMVLKYIFKGHEMGLRLKHSYYWMALLLFLVMPLTFYVLTCKNEIKVGWYVNNNNLTVIAPPVSKTIEVNSIKLILASANGSWEPTLRVNGYRTPDLATGWFKLKNGEKAVVFKHLDEKKLVVIESDDHYYILTHPGIEEFYEFLLSNGAVLVDESR